MTTGDFGDNIIAPNDEPEYASDEEENDDKNDTSDDFAFLGHGFFRFLLLMFFVVVVFILLVVVLALELIESVFGGGAGFELAGIFIKIKNLGGLEEVFGSRDGGFGWGFWLGGDGCLELGGFGWLSGEDAVGGFDFGSSGCFGCSSGFGWRFAGDGLLGGGSSRFFSVGVFRGST